jgi:hypothetical protein
MTRLTEDTDFQTRRSRKEKAMVCASGASRRDARVFPRITILFLAFVGSVWARPAKAGQPVTLAEAAGADRTTLVQIELKAQGLFRPGLPPSGAAAETRMPKPLTLEIQTRLVFNERLVASAGGGAANHGQPTVAGNDPRPGAGTLKAIRHVVHAASAINGQVRPTTASIRPDVALLVASRRDRDGPVVVVSPAGPLTRPELELVQGLGDPLALPDLLPEGPVEVGQTWRVRPAAAQTLSGYDELTTNSLEARLESADDAVARIRLKGQIQGRVLGGAGTITGEGFLSFDRRLARIDHLDLNRVETRQPGPVEAGLDVRSTLTVTRRPAEHVPALSDAALAEIPLDVTPERELLRLLTPGGKSTLLHDRAWHTFWEDPRLTVLKRLKSGQIIAQLNLMVGPFSGKGRHQDPVQFRDDIRRALNHRFVEFLGTGEVDGDPAGGFRYKVGVQGRDGDLGVVWYYYLIAGPTGDQLLATFTLAQDHMQIFGNQDLELVGSLRWLTAPAAALAR